MRYRHARRPESRRPGCCGATLHCKHSIVWTNCGRRHNRLHLNLETSSDWRQQLPLSLLLRPISEMFCCYRPRFGLPAHQCVPPLHPTAFRRDCVRTRRHREHSRSILCRTCPRIFRRPRGRTCHHQRSPPAYVRTCFRSKTCRRPTFRAPCHGPARTQGGSPDTTASRTPHDEIEKPSSFLQVRVQMRRAAKSISYSGTNITVEHKESALPGVSRPSAGPTTISRRGFGGTGLTAGQSHQRTRVELHADRKRCRYQEPISIDQGVGVPALLPQTLLPHAVFHRDCVRTGHRRNHAHLPLCQTCGHLRGWTPHLRHAPHGDARPEFHLTFRTLQHQLSPQAFARSGLRPTFRPPCDSPGRR